VRDTGAISPATPSKERYLSGQLISNKYRLIRPLEEGGMGTVWVAHNQDLDLPVAIKLIRSEVQSPETNRRLANEARILARLGHPAILRVHDFGKTDDGDPYIVMELLHGECLDTTLEEHKKLDALWAVQLLLPIADGLAVAHDRAIVHRDLKPANIFLAHTVSGRLQPKILDFGIAQFDQSRDLRVTRDGALLGSPLYMPPEQARGEHDVDHRADIWSFCVVLYEALAGQIPFDGENYNAVLRAIIEQKPAPITDYGTGDAALWEIIERGLQKRPTRRWQSIRELGTALAQWLVSHGVAQDASRGSLYGTWLAVDSGQAVTSLSPVTVPLSASATPTLSDDTAAVPLTRPSRPASRGRLSTGGHGALARGAGFDAYQPPASRRLAVTVAATTALAGVGATLWVLQRGPAPPPAAAGTHPAGAPGPAVAVPPAATAAAQAKGSRPRRAPVTPHAAPAAAAASAPAASAASASGARVTRDAPRGQDQRRDTRTRPAARALHGAAPLTGARRAPGQPLPPSRSELKSPY
jgi:serine/threonine protein kinase